MRPSQLEAAVPESVGLNSFTLNRIDSLAYDMIYKKARRPVARVLAMKDGKMVYHKNFGFYDYSRKEAVTDSSVYDLASVTKICATTLSVMRLYDEGKISLDSTLGTYLPWVRGSGKENLLIRDVLLHQAGLELIPFYRSSFMKTAGPIPRFSPPAWILCTASALRKTSTWILGSNT